MMHERENKELKKRAKGLLALMLAFMLMFGSSLTVLAVEYDISGTLNLTPGEKLQTGDKFVNKGSYVNSGNINFIVKITDTDTTPPSETEDYVASYEVKDGATYTFKSADSSTATLYLEKTTLISSGTGTTPPANPQTPTVPQNPPVSDDRTIVDNGSKEGSGSGGHTHSYNWETIYEPTKDADGLEQLRCECGSVAAQQPISRGFYYVGEIIDLIRNAPANGTVVLEYPLYNCFTAKILQALAERSDVSIQVTFTDGVGEGAVNRTFTIPAGGASAILETNPDEQFWGFLYFGSIYGWN